MGPTGCASLGFRAVLLTLTGLLAACGPALPDLRVVLISMDTLRYDRFAGAAAAMPRLAAAARNGTSFNRCYSATSSTQPSHASMFTGRHPWQHGVTRNGMVLPAAVTTVAEILAAHGFSTAAAVASFPLEHRFGFEQGFDVYRDDFTLGRPAKKTWSGHEPDWKHFYSPADKVTEEALALIDEAQGARQFFFFHFFDAHSPYGDAPGPDRSDSPGSGTMTERIETRQLTAIAKQHNSELPDALQRARDAYDRDVSFMDRNIGRLLRRLARDADTVETHIIITADHGESFGDDGSFGHGDRLTEVQLHVPLVIVSPQTPAGLRNDAAGSVDIARTLLALAGVNPGLLPGGRNLLPLPSSPTPGPVGMRRTYVEPANDVRTNGEVVALSGQRFYQLRDEGLIVGDGQTVPLNDSSASGLILTPEAAAALRGLFTGFQHALLTSGADERLDDETQAALDALGYTR